MQSPAHASSLHGVERTVHVGRSVDVCFACSLQLTKIAVQQGLLQQGGMPFLSQAPLLPGSTAPGTYVACVCVRI